MEIKNDLRIDWKQVNLMCFKNEGYPHPNVLQRVTLKIDPSSG